MPRWTWILLSLLLAIAPAQAQAPHAHRAALGMGAAFSPVGELWIVALDAQGRLYAQTSRDAGRRWSAPRVLPTGGERISADGETRPKIAFGPRGQVVVSYTQPQARPHTGFIRLLRSSDGGRTFEPPVTVHEDRQPITHRFESIAFDARGTLHTVWIDKRDLEANRAAREAGGGESYRGAAIYRNESVDGGRSFGPDTKVADHTCECCRIALAPHPRGGVVAMWRHVFEPNERDHAFAWLGRSSEPVRATWDRWRLDGCPHHGPGLAAAAGGGWHAVWFGERDAQARVRYGRLGPDGAPQGEAVALPDDGAEHADVASTGRHVAIAWRSFDGRPPAGAPGSRATGAPATR
jgi:hypothetical protein